MEETLSECVCSFGGKSQPTLLACKTDEFTSKAEREWESIVDKYSFINIVSILKSTLIEKGSFDKEHVIPFGNKMLSQSGRHVDYHLVYDNLMKYIRKHSNLQREDPSIRDKDMDELRQYPISNPKLKKMINFMWEESVVFPVYLIISIIKGWIVHKVFQYDDDESFLKYIEEGLQVNINDFLFLIEMKEKKVGTLNRDEKIRLLGINEMIIRSSSGKIAKIMIPKTIIVHSTPEEDVWLLEQIERKIQSE